MGGELRNHAKLSSTARKAPLPYLK